MYKANGQVHHRILQQHIKIMSLAQCILLYIVYTIIYFTSTLLNQLRLLDAFHQTETVFHHLETLNLVMGDLSFIMELSSVRFFYITPNPFTYTETKEDLTTSACFHRAIIPSLLLSSDENDYGFLMTIILTYTKFPSVYYYKRVRFMNIVDIPLWSLNRGAIGFF